MFNFEALQLTFTLKIVETLAVNNFFMMQIAQYIL